MGYIEDFNERSSGNKIPYDDIPISRRPQNKKQSSGGFTFPGVKVLASIIAVLVIVNIALIISTFYYLKHSVVKTINYNYNQITSDVSSVSTAAVQNAAWSSVAIVAGINVTDEYSFYNEKGLGISRGSGTILKKENGIIYILTCYHVIDGNENKVYVMPYGGLTPVKATTVGYASKYDLAVLKVDESDAFDGSLALKEYDSKYLSVGDPTFVVGNSMGLGITATSGIVARLDLLVSTETVTNLRVLQTSAEMNPGNSGGGLFNYQGQFIGVNNAKFANKTTSSGNVTVEGMGYAIPGSFAISVAERIIEKNGTPTHVDIGVDFYYDTRYNVTAETVEYRGEVKYINKYYCIVNSITAGSIADGKLQVGDLVKLFKWTDKAGVTHEEQMYNIYSFENVMFSIKEGTDIVFEVSRHLTDKTITIKASSFST